MIIKECKRGHSEEAYVNPRGVAECRACRRTKMAEYRKNNLAKVQKDRRNYMRRMRKLHPEKMSRMWKEWVNNNKETVKQYGIKYRLNNPEKTRELRSAYKARKRSTAIGSIDLVLLLRVSNGICGICKDPINEMYHIDHIMPLSKGGTHTQENLQITHPICNLKKGNKVLNYA